MGTGGGAAGAAGRGAGRPGTSSKTTRRAAAAFPTGKTFEAWDPALSSIPAPTQSALRTLEWIGRRENLVVCGPSGTGKTMFLEALGQAAVDAGRRVAWFSLESLGVLVRRHRADDSVTKAIARILRADLVLSTTSGSWPWVPTPPRASTDSSTPPTNGGRWRSARTCIPRASTRSCPRPSPPFDRLMHHAHLCQTSGDSVRLAQALSGKGVEPLA